MRAVLIFLGLILGIHFLHSQENFDFQADNNFLESYSPLLRKVKHKFKKSSQFEIRFWKSGGISIPSKTILFILTNDGQNWSAKAFDFTQNKGKTKAEKLIIKSNPELIWRSLKKNDVAVLPDMAELKERLVFTNRDGYKSELRVEDGINYTIEILNRKGSRKYQYYCPNAHLEKITSIEELAKMVEIIKTIYKAIESNLEPC